mmetsp:Transcript_27798/g.64612  ORF Transcript_27798/g.64612 Transcript_27798/m.64612 type:complete len:196 (+) Transcript_27798:62-649(+)
MKRCAPICSLRPGEADPATWSLAKRLRRLGMEVDDTCQVAGPDTVRGEFLLSADADMLDYALPPQVRLCDADGDVADEFWEESNGPGGRLTLQEMSAKKGSRLSIVAVQGEAGLSLASKQRGQCGARSHNWATEQIRLELMSKSVLELRRLLDRLWIWYRPAWFGKYNGHPWARGKLHTCQLWIPNTNTGGWTSV